MNQTLYVRAHTCAQVGCIIQISDPKKNKERAIFPYHDIILFFLFRVLLLLDVASYIPISIYPEILLIAHL